MRSEVKLNEHEQAVLAAFYRWTFEVRFQFSEAQTEGWSLPEWQQSGSQHVPAPIAFALTDLSFAEFSAAVEFLVRRGLLKTAPSAHFFGNCVPLAASHGYFRFENGPKIEFQLAEEGACGVKGDCVGKNVRLTREGRASITTTELMLTHGLTDELGLLEARKLIDIEPRFIPRSEEIARVAKMFGLDVPTTELGESNVSAVAELKNVAAVMPDLAAAIGAAMDRATRNFREYAQADPAIVSIHDDVVAATTPEQSALRWRDANRREDARREFIRDARNLLEASSLTGGSLDELRVMLQGAEARDFITEVTITESINAEIQRIRGGIVEPEWTSAEPAVDFLGIIDQLIELIESGPVGKELDGLGSISARLNKLAKLLGFANGPLAYYVERRDPWFTPYCELFEPYGRGRARFNLYRCKMAWQADDALGTILELKEFPLAPESKAHVLRTLRCWRREVEGKLNQDGMKQQNARKKYTQQTIAPESGGNTLDGQVVTQAKPITLPRLGPHDRQAYQLSIIDGMTQVEIAAKLNQEHGTTYSQGRISILIKRAKRHADASGLSNLIPPLAQPAKPIDPHHLEIGKRTDHRTRSQRSKPE